MSRIDERQIVWDISFEHNISYTLLCLLYHNFLFFYIKLTKKLAKLNIS